MTSSLKNETLRSDAVSLFYCEERRCNNKCLTPNLFNFTDYNNNNNHNDNNNLIVTLFQADNIFGLYTSLTYGPQ